MLQASADSSGDELSPGAILGKYRLSARLGEGAMGVVYRGFHAMLRRPTAIKMLDVDKVNEGSIERFEREVQITSQLNHPNTVAIYDYGRLTEAQKAEKRMSALELP